MNFFKQKKRGMPRFENPPPPPPPPQVMECGNEISIAVDFKYVGALITVKDLDDEGKERIRVIADSGMSEIMLSKNETVCRIVQTTIERHRMLDIHNYTIKIRI